MSAVDERRMSATMAQISFNASASTKFGRAAIGLSAEIAAHTWSQTSIWTILVQFRIGVGDHFLCPSRA